ncbi:MAG: hypothetical protein ABS69_08125 [Nitrosomonadales bacterium SCN 54-20]|nr:MAG: hypothetical protein ABS69_08125 [Nitrosomonadales bacterium SCN 54-20]
MEIDNKAEICSLHSSAGKFQVLNVAFNLLQVLQATITGAGGRYNPSVVREYTHLPIPSSSIAG